LSGHAAMLVQIYGLFGHVRGALRPDEPFRCATLYSPGGNIRSTPLSSNGWLKTASVLRVRVIIATRLPRVGLGENRRCRTGDEFLRRRIFLRRLPERRRRAVPAAALRLRSERRPLPGQIVCTQMVDAHICGSARGTALPRRCNRT